MKTKRLFCILFVLCLTIGVLALSVSAADTTASGTCGDTFTWTLDSDGVLTITGEGDMPDEIAWRDYASQVKSVVLTPGITSIANSAFWNFQQMTSVTIPNTVTRIEASAFNDCFALPSVTIPEGIKEIPDYCFSGCYALREVNLPRSLEEIGRWAFYSCPELLYISLPSNVTTIGERAFCDGGPLFLTMPASITKIEENAFGDDGGRLCHIFYAGTEQQWQAISIGAKNSNLTDPVRHYETPDLGITYQSLCWFDKYACTECWEMVAYTYHDPANHRFTNGVCTRCQMPEGLLYGFGQDHIIITGYTGTLANVVIPRSIEEMPVKVIAASAFENNLTLQTITLPNTVIYIGENAFAGCRNLQRFDIPAGVTDIAPLTFHDCSQLKEVTFPENLETIGSCAFWGSGIVDLVLPDGIEVISADAFRFNNKLETVKLPKNLRIIDEYAFSGCSFSTIKLPEGLEEIGASAFRATDLTSIVIPDSVTTIGMHAFNNTKLTSVVVPDSVIYFGNAVFYQCEELVSAKLPDFYTGIPDDTFGACYKLANFQLPAATKTIGMMAFNDCDALTELTIPASVNEIGNMAFMHCNNLKSIIFKGPAPAYGIGHRAFDNDTLEIRYYPSEAWEQVQNQTSLGGNLTWKPIQAAKILTQPQNATAVAGKAVKVNITAEGEGLTYTWYYKNAGAAKFSKSSVTTSTYATTMNSTVDGRQVYCVVTDKFGNTATSEAVTLNLAKPPVITTQPKTSYAKQGATIKLSVAAEGEGLTYTWYYKNAGETKYTKSSVKSATYATTMNDAVKGRMLYCVVTNQYGLSVKTNTCSLRMAATITQQPVDTCVANGKTVKVNVKAVGDGLSYTWYYRNAGATSFSKSSITSASYATTMSDTVDGRQVYCVVKDQYGKTHKSNVVTLANPVKITTQPKTSYAKQGATIKLSVAAEGEGLTYTWYYKNAGETKYTKSSVKSATYSTTMNSTVKGRMLYCVITDQFGNSVKTNTCSLRMAATITAQPKSVSVASGAKATVTVKAAGDGLKYTWYYKNAGATKFSKSSVTSATYSTTMNSTVDGRQVYCVVTDQYGNSVKTNIATIKKS